MGFLRRLLGGEAGRPATGEERRADGGAADDGGARDDGAGEPDEAERERELLRADAARLDDELLQRQLRFADRSWTPPRQGGERRAEDDDRAD